MSLYKTVAVPALGLDHSLKPHAIDARSWTSLAGFRNHNGSVRSFEGWDAISPTVLPSAILGIFEYFKPLTLERWYLVLTQDKAFYLNTTTNVLTEISPGTGMNATHENPWSGVLFQGAMHFTSLESNGMYTFDGTGGQVAGAPNFAFINTLNDYLCGVFERVGTEYYPHSFRWAAEGTNDQWIASPTVDAGEFPLADTPDKCVALYRLGNDLVAYKERTNIPITFIGGNEVFGRRASITDAGLIGPYALANHNDKHYCMGEDTFYTYGGGNVIDDSLGEKIRDLVYPSLNLTLARQVRCLDMRQRMEIAWFYPTQASTGRCDRVVVYNAQEKTWAGPMRIIDFISFVGNFTGLGPTKRFIMGSNSGKLYGHGSSYTENGTMQLRVMESGDISLQMEAVDADGNKAFFPLSTVFQANVLNLDVESTGAPAANVYVGSRLDLNDDISWEGPHTIQGGPLQTIVVPIRRTGRWFRFKLECSDDKELALLGYQFEFERVGNR